MAINSLPPSPAAAERVVRLPLTWILAGMISIVGISLLSGFLAAWWWQPNLAPLPASDRLVTTIQEVTISPSTAMQESVVRHQRSVVLLARAAKVEQVLGTGLVATSDGLIATTASLPSEPLVMLDDAGKTRTLEVVGRDVVFGITYLRAGNGVFVPLEMRDSDVLVGTTLLMLSRNPETLAARAEPVFIEEYRLPEKIDPVGWQRLLGGAELTEGAAAGSPLLDDEGRVAAVVLSERNGRLLPSTLLRFSLDRVASGQLEENPYDYFGLALDYTFAPGKELAQEYQVAVESVRPESSAAQQGIRAGDVIVTLREKPLTWDTPAFSAFQEKQPLVIQVRRGEATRTVTLTREDNAHPAP